MSNRTVTTPFTMHATELAGRERAWTITNAAGGRLGRVARRYDPWNAGGKHFTWQHQTDSDGPCHSADDPWPAESLSEAMRRLGAHVLAHGRDVARQADDERPAPGDGSAPSPRRAAGRPAGRTVDAGEGAHSLTATITITIAISQARPTPSPEAPAPPSGLAAGAP